MAEVSIRDLRNRGGHVVDRASRGERLTITRDGVPVAELRPLDRPLISVEVLVERRRRLPEIDPGRLRAELDDVLDTSV